MDLTSDFLDAQGLAQFEAGFCMNAPVMDQCNSAEFASEAGAHTKRAGVNPLALFDTPTQQQKSQRTPGSTSPRPRRRSKTLPHTGVSALTRVNAPPKVRATRPQRTFELDEVLTSDLHYIAFDTPLATVLETAIKAGDPGASLLAMVYAMMSSASREQPSQSFVHKVFLAGISGVLLFHYDASSNAVASPFTESSAYHAVHSPALQVLLRDGAQPIQRLFSSLVGVAKHQMAVCWKTRGVFLVPTIYIFRWRPDSPGAHCCVPADYPIWTPPNDGAESPNQQVPVLAHEFWSRFVTSHGFGASDATDCGNIDVNIVAYARSPGLAADIVFEKFKVNLLNQAEAPTDHWDVLNLSYVAAEYGYSPAQLEALFQRPPITRIDQVALSPQSGDAFAEQTDRQTVIHAMLECFVARETMRLELATAGLFLFAYKYGLVIRKSTFYMVGGPAGARASASAASLGTRRGSTGDLRPKKRLSRKMSAPAFSAVQAAADPKYVAFCTARAAAFVPFSAEPRPRHDAFVGAPALLQPDSSAPESPRSRSPHVHETATDACPGSPETFGPLGGASSSPDREPEHAVQESVQENEDPEVTENFQPFEKRTNQPDQIPPSVNTDERATNTVDRIAASAEPGFSAMEDVRVANSVTARLELRSNGESVVRQADVQSSPIDAQAECISATKAATIRSRSLSMGDPPRAPNAVHARSPFATLCGLHPFRSERGDLVSSVVLHIMALFEKEMSVPLPNVAERPRLAAIAEAVNVLGVFKRPLETHQFASDEGPRSLAAWVEISASAAKHAPKMLFVAGRCRDLEPTDLRRCIFGAQNASYALVSVVCTEREDVVWANRSRTTWSFHAQDLEAREQRRIQTLEPEDATSFLAALAACVSRKPALYVLARIGSAS